MFDFKKKAEEIRQRRKEPPPELSEEDKDGQAASGIMMVSTFAIMFFVLLSVPAQAAGGDPVATINNLSSFIFGAIRAIGIILLGFGVVQIGLSLKSHDASQRANGFMTFFGGIVITFAKNILDLILG